jgi:hypothetical protein
MAVTGQFTIAREATFTWTAGSGGEDLTTFKVGFTDVAYREGRHYYKTVPVGYLMERVTPGILYCQVALGAMFDKSGSTAPVPGGSSTPPTNPGTLVVTFATGKTKTVKGFLMSLDWTSQGGSVGPEQRYQYLFVGSAEGPSDTITTA